MSVIFAVISVLLALQPPAAPREPYEITAHGHTRTDFYYWLRNADDPETIRYLNGENSYCDSMMAPLQPLMDTLVAEMRSRMPEEDASVPYYRNGFWYWHEYPRGLEYPVNYRRREDGGEPVVLLDENLYAGERDYFMVEAMSVSPDNSILAWAYDTTGGHWNTIVFQDIATGDTLDIVTNASGDIAWAADSRMVFFGLNDPTGRTDRIMRKTVGCDDMICVYTEEDPTFWPWVWNSDHMEWVVISTSSTLESEAWLLRSDTPREEFTLMVPRTPELEYYPEPLGDTFYILTNLEGRNYSIMEASWPNLELESWRTVVPHSESTLVEKVEVFDDLLALSVRTEGLRKLLLVDRDTGAGRFASLGEEASTFYTTANYEAAADSIRLYYSSMTTPWSTCAYDMEADSMRILKMDFAGEDYDRDLYVTERLMAPAEDGTEVPVSLVYRRDMFEEGTNPLLLYAYGAYGSSMNPSFSFTRLSLLDRGFVYAIAHVRGGSEMGRYWYDQGRVLNKMNSFTDFIACADFLIETGYCDPHRVFAMGESAGGLLMGAVINLRPELWCGVVAGVPFVDALTTMLDPSIPLTTNEYDEWGNPTESSEEYFYILSYSPVDNLAEVDYPAIYAYTGLNDSQVGFWEPAKWIAGIRYLNTGAEPVLLRIEMGTGHGGASGRFGWLEDYAEQYAFLIQLAGTGSLR